MIIPPINFMKWIDENRHRLKPPVGNQVVYEDTDFIIMVVGGPNARADFHVNVGEEFFYQIEGDIQLPIIVDNKVQVVDIKEGEIFLLPPMIPHSPQRGSNTVGLVIEKRRPDGVKDGCLWFCDSCNELIHEEKFELDHIVEQLPKIMNEFYDDEGLRTCSNCSTVMEIPKMLD